MKNRELSKTIQIDQKNNTRLNTDSTYLFPTDHEVQTDSNNGKYYISTKYNIVIIL